MKLKDKLLLSISRPVLERNKRFKNLHKGQSCYIFGNGVSLKSMDLGKFNDRIAIGCNSLFIHKDFGKLDCRYYQIPATLTFYPYRRYYGKLQRNYLGDLYKRKIRENRHVNFFTSLSNYFSVRGENIFYTHHFGHGWNLDKREMDGIFSLMEGATYAMLGTAIYMGFESAVLVGVDYTFTPRQSSHFFEKGTGSLENETENNPYGGALFQALQKRIDLTTIVQKGMRSDLLKYVEYEEYVKTPSNYLENTEIVDSHSLACLGKQGFYRIA